MLQFGPGIGLPLTSVWTTFIVNISALIGIVEKIRERTPADDVPVIEIGSNEPASHQEAGTQLFYFSCELVVRGLNECVFRQLQIPA